MKSAVDYLKDESQSKNKSAIDYLDSEETSAVKYSSVPSAEPQSAYLPYRYEYKGGDLYDPYQGRDLTAQFAFGEPMQKPVSNIEAQGFATMKMAGGFIPGLKKYTETAPIIQETEKTIPGKLLGYGTEAGGTLMRYFWLGDVFAPLSTYVAKSDLLRFFGATEKLAGPLGYAASRGMQWGTAKAIKNYSKVLTDMEEPTTKKLVWDVLSAGGWGALLGFSHVSLGPFDNSLTHGVLGAIIGGGREILNLDERLAEKQYRAAKLENALIDQKIDLYDVINIGTAALFTGIVETVGHEQLKNAWKRAEFEQFYHEQIITKLMHNGLTEKQAESEYKWMGDFIWNLKQNVPYVQIMADKQTDFFDKLPVDQQIEVVHKVRDSLTKSPFDFGKAWQDALKDVVGKTVPFTGLFGAKKAVVKPEKKPEQLPTIFEKTPKVTEAKEIGIRGEKISEVSGADFRRIAIETTGKANPAEMTPKEQKQFLAKLESFKTGGKSETERITPAANKYLAMAHSIKNKKQIPDEDYRKLALELTGKSSMSKMTVDEQRLFAERLRADFEKPTDPAEVKQQVTGNILPATKFKGPGITFLVRGKEQLMRQMGLGSFVDQISIRNKEFAIEYGKRIKNITKMFRKLAWQDPFYERQIAKLTKKGTTSQEYIRDLLDTFEHLSEAANLNRLTKLEQKAFTELRNLTREVHRKKNEVRQRMGLDPIPYQTAYVPHFLDDIFRVMIREKSVDFNQYQLGPFPVPERIKQRILKNAHPYIHTPTEYERKIKGDLAEIFSKNPEYLFRSMLWHDLKFIYLAEPNKAVLDMAKDALNKNQISARQYQEIIDYLNYDIYKHPHLLDEIFNNSLHNYTHADDIINFILKPLNRVITNPMRLASNIFRRVIVDAAVIGRIPLVISVLLDRLITTQYYPIHDFLKAQLLPIPNELKSKIQSLPNFQLIKRPEDISGIISAVEKLGYYPVTKGRESTAMISAATAYYAAKEIGWSEQDAMREASEAIANIQLIFFGTEMPRITRSHTGRMLNAMMNTFEHAVFRREWEAFARIGGKTSWGKEIPWKWRINAIKGVAFIAGLLWALKQTTGLTYGRMAFLISGGPLFYLNPIGQSILAMMNYATAWSDWQKAMAKKQLLDAWKYPFIPKGWRDIQRYLSGETDIIELLSYKRRKQTGPGQLFQ